MSRKTIKTILLSLFLISGIFGATHIRAQTKSEYYKRLFGEEFGFTMHEVDKNTASKEDYLSTNPDKSYTLFLSSSFQITDTSTETENTELVPTDYFDSKSKIILICDSSFSTDAPFEIDCDKEEARSSSMLTLGDFLKSYNSQWDLYVFPENTLLTEDKRSSTKDYISALRRADKAESTLEEPKVVSGTSLVDEIRKYVKTPTFEMFALAFSMLVIVSLTKGVLKLLSEKDKRLNLTVLSGVFDDIKKINSKQKVILLALMGMLVFYVTLMISISIKDKQGIDLGYILSYSKETFSIKTLSSMLEKGSYSRILLFFLGELILLLISIALLPHFFDTAKIGFSKIKASRLKGQFIKYSVPILILMLLFVLSTMGVTNISGLIIFLSLVLTYIILNGRKKEMVLYVYSLKERLIFTLLGVAFITCGIWIRTFNSGENIKYGSEDLIGVRDSVVLLPYSKQLGENTIVNPYQASFDEPIFVDNYLVYSPNHSRIENKNANDFKNTGTYYIQGGKTEDILKTVDANEEMMLAIKSDSPTAFFRLKLPQGDLLAEKYQIQLILSCNREKLDKDKIEISYLFADNGNIRSSKDTLLYFPGCVEIGNEETFTVPFEPPSSSSETLYVKLENVADTDISSITVLTENGDIFPTYIKSNSEYKVIGSGGLTDSTITPITNYIFGDSYDLSFDVVLDEEGRFDMANPINELIKEGILKDGFLIWSTQRYLPVKTPD